MKFTIEWIYQTKNGIETVFQSSELTPEEALIIAEDLEKTGRVKKITFIDNYDTTWLKKEVKKYLKEMETEPHHVVVYFDGGFDIQTKQSGLGCAIYFDQNGKSYRLRKNSFTEDVISNNEAEYAALYFSIVELELMDVHHQTVKFIGDSQVVINQMNGTWPAYEKELANWADRVDEKLKQLGIIPEFQLVSRENNEEADRLASQGLKGIKISGKIQIHRHTNQ